MNRIAGRKALFEKVRALVADPAQLKSVQENLSPPAPVVQFVANLELLSGVPFNYLVADEALLPVESMRFFQVDPNWIYALIEGAASIGSSTSSDEAHDAVTRPGLHDASTRAARAVRAHRNEAVAAVANLTTATSGFLLRSAVVSGWPGLEVTAYDAQSNVLPVIRMDRLAPTILLFWAEGIIDRVNIHEPPEGMHFGVDISGGKMLRYVTATTGVPGAEIAGSLRSIEQRGNNVLKIDPLASTLQKGLQAYMANNYLDGIPRAFTAAEFALQMVEAAQSVIFVNQAPARGKR